MKPLSLAALAAGAAILAAQPALAIAPVGDPLAGLQAMRQLNSIVLGNADGWLVVEGKTFIAGDLKNGGAFGTGNAKQGAAASDYATLTVGGNTSGNIVTLANGANGAAGKVASQPSIRVAGDFAGANIEVADASVKVGGTIRNTNASSGTLVEAGGKGQGYLNANGGKITTKLGSDFADPLRASISSEAESLEADLKALSKSLAGLETTKGNSIENNYGAWTLAAVDNGQGFSVFNLTEAQLNGWQFTLKPADPALTIVFNILGDGAYKWNTSLAGAFNADFAGQVIWNFADAKAIDASQSIFGSVLAPYADFASKSAITGSVVSAGLKASSGVKLGTYDGSELGLATDAVPEPATWAMLIAGFGLVGVAMRRKRPLARVAA